MEETVPKLEPCEKQSRFRTLKSLIPFFESQGFIVKKGIDHLVVYPYDMTENQEYSTVDIKVDGQQIVRQCIEKISETTNQFVTDIVSSVTDIIRDKCKTR